MMKFRSNKLVKVICIILILVFASQQVAWAKHEDLRKSPGAGEYLLNIGLGYMQGRVINPNWSVLEAITFTYLIPKIAETAVKAMNIDNKTLAFILQVAISVALTSRFEQAFDKAGNIAAKAQEVLNKAGLTAERISEIAAKEGVDVAQKAVTEALKNSGEFTKYLADALGKSVTDSAVKEAVEAIGAGVKAALEAGGKAAGKAALRQAVEQAVNAVVNPAAMNIGKWLQELFKNPFKMVANAVKDFWRSVKSVFTKSGNKALVEGMATPWAIAAKDAARAAVYAAAQRTIYNSLEKYNPDLADFVSGTGGMIVAHYFGNWLFDKYGISPSGEIVSKTPLDKDALNRAMAKAIMDKEFWSQLKISATAEAVETAAVMLDENLRDLGIVFSSATRSILQNKAAKRDAQEKLINERSEVNNRVLELNDALSNSALTEEQRAKINLELSSLVELQAVLNDFEITDINQVEIRLAKKTISDNYAALGGDEARETLMAKKNGGQKLTSQEQTAYDQLAELYGLKTALEDPNTVNIDQAMAKSINSRGAEDAQMGIDQIRAKGEANYTDDDKTELKRLEGRKAFLQGLNEYYDFLGRNNNMTEKQALTYGLMSGLISVGMQKATDLATRNNPYTDPRDVAFFMAGLSGFAQGLLVKDKYLFATFTQSAGPTNRPNYTNLAFKDDVRQDGSIRLNLALQMMDASLIKAAADFISFGRYSPYISWDEKGMPSWGVDIANRAPMDEFYFRRYAKFHETMMENEDLGYGYAMSDQFTSSLHNQATSNVNDIVTGAIQRPYVLTLSRRLKELQANPVSREVLGKAGNLLKVGFSAGIVNALTMALLFLGSQGIPGELGQQAAGSEGGKAKDIVEGSLQFADTRNVIAQDSEYGKAVQMVADLLAKESNGTITPEDQEKLDAVREYSKDMQSFKGKASQAEQSELGKAVAYLAYCRDLEMDRAAFYSSGAQIVAPIYSYNAKDLAEIDRINLTLGRTGPTTDLASTDPAKVAKGYVVSGYDKFNDLVGGEHENVYWGKIQKPITFNPISFNPVALPQLLGPVNVNVPAAGPRTDEIILGAIISLHQTGVIDVSVNPVGMQDLLGPDTQSLLPIVSEAGWDVAKNKTTGEGVFMFYNPKTKQVEVFYQNEFGIKVWSETRGTTFDDRGRMVVNLSGGKQKIVVNPLALAKPVLDAIAAGNQGSNNYGLDEVVYYGTVRRDSRGNPLKDAKGNVICTSQTTVGAILRENFEVPLSAAQYYYRDDPQALARVSSTLASSRVGISWEGGQRSITQMLLSVADGKKSANSVMSGNHLLAPGEEKCFAHPYLTQQALFQILGEDRGASPQRYSRLMALAQQLQKSNNPAERSWGTILSNSLETSEVVLRISKGEQLTEHQQNFLRNNRSEVMSFAASYVNGNRAAMANNAQVQQRCQKVAGYFGTTTEQLLAMPVGRTLTGTETTAYNASLGRQKQGLGLSIKTTVNDTSDYVALAAQVVAGNRAQFEQGVSQILNGANVLTTQAQASGVAVDLAVPTRDQFMEAYAKDPKQALVMLNGSAAEINTKRDQANEAIRLNNSTAFETSVGSYLDASAALRAGVTQVNAGNPNLNLTVETAGPTREELMAAYQQDPVKAAQMLQDAASRINVQRDQVNTQISTANRASFETSVGSYLDASAALRAGVTQVNAGNPNLNLTVETAGPTREDLMAAYQQDPVKAAQMLQDAASRINVQRDQVNIKIGAANIVSFESSVDSFFTAATTLQASVAQAKAQNPNLNVNLDLAAVPTREELMAAYQRDPAIAAQMLQQAASKLEAQVNLYNTQGNASVSATPQKINVPPVQPGPTPSVSPSNGSPVLTVPPATLDVQIQPVVSQNQLALTPSEQNLTVPDIEPAKPTVTTPSVTTPEDVKIETPQQTAELPGPIVAVSSSKPSPILTTSSYVPDVEIAAASPLTIEPIASKSYIQQPYVTRYSPAETVANLINDGENIKPNDAEDAFKVYRVVNQDGVQTGVHHIEFSNIESQNTSFNRISAFVEGVGNKGKPGQVISEQAADALPVGAHDLQLSDIARFYNTAKNLRPQEQRILERLQEYGLIYKNEYTGKYESLDDRGAIVTVPHNDANRREYALHEHNHGMFFSNPDFEREATGWWNGMSNGQREGITQLLTKMGYAKDTRLLIREGFAYFSDEGESVTSYIESLNKKDPKFAQRLSQLGVTPDFIHQTSQSLGGIVNQYLKTTRPSTTEQKQ